MTEFVDRRKNNGPLPDDVAQFLQSAAEMSGIGTYGDGTEIAEDQWIEAERLCYKYKIIFMSRESFSTEQQLGRDGKYHDITIWSDGVWAFEDGTELTKEQISKLQEPEPNE